MFCCCLSRMYNRRYAYPKNPILGLPDTPPVPPMTSNPTSTEHIGKRKRADSSND